jgi:hypothetical protein
MQQKRRYPAKFLFLGATGLVLIIGFGALMMTDIAAPVTTIEKELDAQTFLQPRQS